MSNLDKMIEEAKLAYMAIATAYDQADINRKMALAPMVEKAQSKLVALQSRKLAQSVTITDEDLAEMVTLRNKINRAAELQAALEGIIRLVSKFVL